MAAPPSSTMDSSRTSRYRRGGSSPRRVPPEGEHRQRRLRGPNRRLHPSGVNRQNRNVHIEDDESHEPTDLRASGRRGPAETPGGGTPSGMLIQMFDLKLFPMF
ncbi:hypothetical protein EYF80_043357 [Liparis tanakae]|uniref:Uncharacterized protein n=1 Tax=Liparis tanakae TaxID=230148 RepID=A0A4Z2FZM3_9TELE|nr:hypothetical protein EYF80_043357 [Liparis tanakae]